MKAFPFVVPADEHNGSVVYMGMDLRDWFAGMAMMGMIASQKLPTGIMIDTAEEAYVMADHMMKAREK